MLSLHKYYYYKIITEERVWTGVEEVSIITSPSEALDIIITRNLVKNPDTKNIVVDKFHRVK